MRGGMWQWLILSAAIVFSAKVGPAPPIEQLFTKSNYYTGFSLFWGGLTMGACNLLCGALRRSRQ